MTDQRTIEFYNDTEDMDKIPGVIDWIAVRLVWFTVGMFGGYLWFFKAFGMTITINGGR